MPQQKDWEPHHETHELGPPVAEYRYCFADYLLRGLALLLLCVSILGYSAYRGTWGGEAGIGLILGMPGVFYLSSALRKRGLRVVRCEHGLLHVWGHQHTAFPWERIESVWQRHTRVLWLHLIPGRVTYHFVLRRDDGRQVTLTGELESVAELGAAVVRETAKHMLSRAVETLSGGGAVRFGRLEARTEGLVLPHEVLPWDTIQSVSVTGGKIRIRRRGKWLHRSGGSSARTPNLHVLLPLIDQMADRAVRENRGRRDPHR